MDNIQQTWSIIVSLGAGLAVIVGLITNMRKLIAEFNAPLNKLSATVDKLAERVEDVKKHDEIIDKSILAMQRQQILESCERCLQQGFASMEEKQTISWQFKSYHELGGNSFVEDMVKQVENLPMAKAKKKTTTKKEG